jgi:hypothetical protein
MHGSRSKIPVKISSGSVARRDLIPTLKGLGLLKERGAANLPNFETENAGCLLFLTSQITTGSSFDIQTDQRNSCLYFYVLNLFVF